jgi:acetyl esterase/lipase
MSAPADPVAAALGELRATYARWRRSTPVESMRRDWDELFRSRAKSPPPPLVDVAGLRAAWVDASDCDPCRIVLYLHGGGFRLGSIVSHLDLTQRLAAAARSRVLALEYRLAPEHLFPSALDDALSAYRWLLNTHAGARIAFAGDSAGGGLCLSAMLAARDQGLPLPCACFTMSAWTDLEAKGASYQANAACDPIHPRAMILAIAGAYLGPHGHPRDPRASPINGDLAGLPPLLLQCGGNETVLDDTRGFAIAARAAGVPVSLEIYEGMFHVFQMFGELADAQRAVASAGAFLSRAFEDRRSQR